jgi:hypothetical protein
MLHITVFFVHLVAITYTHIRTHICFAVLEFELRALCLLGRHSNTWVMTPALFHFSYFSGRVSHFCLGQPQIIFFLPVASRIVMMTGTCHHPWLFVWDGILISFFSRLALNSDPTDLCLPSRWDYQHGVPCPATSSTQWHCSTVLKISGI